MAHTWAQRAEESFQVLLRRYRVAPSRPGWPGLFRLADPPTLRQCWQPLYWWQAQALDALVDAAERDPTRHGSRARLRSVPAGVRLSNLGRIGNIYNDDMAWLALALLRADDAGALAAAPAHTLYRRIIRTWNDIHGASVPWRSTQPDYKNVPANGPVAILAARLYQRGGDPELLRIAQQLTDWIDATLVDPDTCLVWDGIGRCGDGAIDREWRFTYTHGVVIGAHAVLHELTGAERHARRVHESTDVVLQHLLGADGLLQDEGVGDGALFRGILVRYLAQVDDPRVAQLLLHNGEHAWAARDQAGRFGPSWRTAPERGSELSAHLSGLMLMEQLARLEVGRGPGPALPAPALPGGDPAP